MCRVAQQKRNCRHRFDGIGRLLSTLLVMILWSLIFTADSSAETPAPKSPLSPAEALRQFVLHPQLALELVAAEPDVVDPVAIRFDEDGRMWVVEMRDYPNGPAPGKPPASQIRLLEDRDGDGRYETSRVFADKLLFATGIQPWRGGVIVTLAGRVEYMRDTDGDGRADFRETWFTGFAEKNTQLRANHPTFALDNHVYVANGLRGGQVVSTNKKWAESAAPVSISGMDFRFNPVGGAYESVSGNGQFGLTFDDFGNRFVCSNRNPCKHIVLEDRYIKRNPHLAVRSVFHDVSPIGERSRIYPISRTWVTSTLHEGQVTSACGVTNYRGDLLPTEFHGNSFTCEPTSNMVHRDVLKPKAATFTAHAGRKQVEFLATRDEWFRAVNLENGPDGALYVVDMYRAVVEHPQWVPDELKNRPDVRYGDDRGRIYRIVPADGVGSKRRRAIPKLSRASTAELAGLLAHANAWHRETAARLIYERQESSSAAPLERLARNGKTPQARVHALWALNGLGKLTPATVKAALGDKHPRVREQAVRLAEGFARANAGIRKKLLSLTKDGDARLRFQVALSLGEINGDKQTAGVADSLATVTFSNLADPWTRLAALSSIADEPADLLNSISVRMAINNRWNARGMDDLVKETAELIGARQRPEEISKAFFPLADIASLPAIPENDPHYHRIQFSRIAGLGRGTARRGKSLRSFINLLPKPQQQELDELFSRAAKVAADERADTDYRQAATAVLEYAGYTIAGDALQKLASSRVSQSLRLQAISMLAKFADDEIGPFLLDDFATQAPPVRRAIFDALLSNTGRTLLLLKEIEAGRIKVAELDPARTARLLKHGNGEIRKLSAKLLAAAIPADRKRVLSDYQAVLSLKADPVIGRQVFNKNCTACHRIGKLGVDVAPDIADSRTRKPAQLLLSILDPNRAVDSNYFSYTVVTTAGKVLTGVISAETASSVTLREQENKTATILRQDIETIRSNGVSLMPVGLEKNINHQQMADLISFIKNWRYLDGRVPIKVK